MKRILSCHFLKFSCPFFGVLLYSNALFCTNPIDSLEAELRSVLNDSAKVDVLIQLCNAYISSDREKAMVYANRALTIAERADLNSGKADAYSKVAFLNMGVDNELALDYAKKSLDLYKRAGNQKREASVTNNIGTILQMQGNFPEAMKAYFKSLKIYEELKDTKGVAHVYNNFGTMYVHMNNDTLASYYFQKAMEKYEEIGNKRGIANCSNNIGLIYRDRANYKDALEYLERALLIWKDLDDPQSISMCLSNIAGVYIGQKKYTEALGKVADALKINDEIGSQKYVGQNLQLMGEIYYQQKRFQLALEYVLKSIKVLKQADAKIELVDAYSNLIDIYVQLDDFENAYKYDQILFPLTDSLFNTESVGQMNDIRIKYEAEEKENQIMLLSKKNAIKASEIKRHAVTKNTFIVACILFLVLVLLLYRTIQLKQHTNKVLKEKNQEINLQKQELEKRKIFLESFSEQLQKENTLAQYKTLKNQVNPHFLFNSLSDLSALIISNPKKAIAFTNEFSKVYRYILELKENLVIEVTEELDLINSYLFLQKIRFGESLKIAVNIDPEYLDSFIPPFSLQLLVENAIKHNTISEESPLDITIYSQNEFLIVKNNTRHRPDGKKSTGVSIKNLIDRYEIVSKIKPEFVATEQEYIAKIPIIQHE